MFNESIKVSLRIGVVVIILLVLGEFLVRIFFTHPQQTLPDSVLGWVYKPGSSILYAKEGFATNQINSFGMNDDELDMTRNKTRILVLGDSFTEALHVQSDVNFTKQAEDSLYNTDIINAGRSGLSPLYYPTVLDRVILSIAPDSVVLVLTAGDIKDIKNGDFEIFTSQQGEIVNGVVLKPRQQEKLREYLEPILKKSALFTYITRRVIEANIGDIFKLKNGDKSEKFSSHINDKEILKILKYLMSEIKARKPVSILYLPSLNYKANRIAIETDESKKSYSLFNLAAEANDIYIVTALDTMKNVYKISGQPPVGFPNKNILHGHLNKRGHEAVSQSLLKLLKHKNVNAQHLNNL